MNDDEKIVGIYKRVSTTDQVNEGHSLEEQETRCRKQCEFDNNRVYKVYSDAGISGKSIENRPGYQQMMADMRKGKINLIMAFKMDRLGRSIVDLEEFFNETKKYNCGVELLCEKIDTNSASGMMFVRMLAIFAQFERETIRERTIVGVEGAINKGHFGGPIPFGYKKVENSKLYVIDEKTAPIVREIYDLSLKGNSYQKIAHMMKDKYGYLTYTRKNKETGKISIVQKSWTDSTIQTILNNKIYYGVWEHKKKTKDKKSIEIIGYVPPIITEDMFYECQDNLRKNSRNYYRNKRYLFMQKIECPKCGRIMACTGTKKPNGKEYLYYRCKDCKKTDIREELIEEALIEHLITFLELYLIIEEDYVVTDADTADAIANGKIDHSIRYAMDSIGIESRLNNSNCNFLKYFWDIASYEVKCEFIYQYIDIVKIKKHTRNKKDFIEILDIKLKPRTFKKLFGMVEKNMIDEIEIETSGNDISEAVFSSKQQADEYIELLRKKYNIRVIDMRKWEIWNNYDNVFKMITIASRNVVEQDNILFLELVTD